MSEKIITVIEPKDLVVGKCYRCLNDGKYMGQYTGTITSGRSDEPEYIYNFTKGNGNTHSKPIFSELVCSDSNVDIICYDPNITNDGKHQCPICKSVEKGTSRLINHNFGCQNKGKNYCVQSGGRKKRKTTKNNRKTTKNNRKTTKNNRKK